VKTGGSKEEFSFLNVPMRIDPNLADSS